MSVINDKDATTRLENIRILRETDPCFYSVFNRPLEDLEQRTDDINHNMFPGRGLRVKATATPSLTVEVEAGYYMTDDTTVVEFPVGAISSSVTVALSSPGTIRIDLVYFDIATGTVATTTGTEAAKATGFSVLFANTTPLRAILPVNNGYIPLAYLYVDDTPTMALSNIIPINYAGHIRDARLAPGAEMRPFTATSGTLQADATGGSPGASPYSVRADHRHPLNVTSTAPKQLTPSSANSIGASTEPAYSKYSRADHGHSVTVQDVGDYATDVSGGDAGSLPKFARADHGHKENGSVGVTPENLGPALAASAGSSLYYAREDHRHKIIGNVKLATENYFLSWAHEAIAKQTPFPLTVRPSFCFMYMCGTGSPAVGDYFRWGWNTWGFYGLTDGVLTPASDPRGGVGVIDKYTAPTCYAATTTDFVYPVGHPVGGAGWVDSGFSTQFTVNAFSQAAGVQMTPSLTEYATVGIVIFGFIDV